SAALRDDKGQILAKVGDHAKFWQNADPKRSTPTHVRVPITKSGQLWGTVEVAFKPLSSAGTFSFLSGPTFGLIAFVSISGFCAYFFYMRRMLRHLDPSSVIPDRVKTMLNTLAEGVLILDKQERIVIANDAFATIVARSCTELQGQQA